MDSAILILFISVVIIGAALLMVISLRKRPSRMLNQAQYQQQWLTIEQSVSDDVGSMQLAILNADKLLDKALRERGFNGQTMGERLKACGKQLTQTNAVWTAHKIRNKIAHEDTVTINRRLTTQALKTYKQALRDLGAL